MMTSATRLWRKARGKDPRYLMWKVFDRLGKKSRRFTRRLASRVDQDQMAARFRSGGGTIQMYLLSPDRPQFFFTSDEADVLIEALAGRDANYRQRVLERADAVCRHEIRLIAVGQVALGERIDWHRDYHSGLRWENRYAFDYDFLDLDRPSDVRIVWELNRLHFLIDLGKAYRLSGDDKYVRKLVELVTDWDAANPVEFSINWTCAMEAAIRAVNLLWALMFCLPSNALDDAFLARLLRMLVQHGRFIRQNLEYSDVRGNHYLADLTGLIYLGVLLPEWPEARSWLAYALPRFVGEMEHQVHTDGVDHEGSIPYHRLVTELFLSPARLLERNGYRLPEAFDTRLEKMLEFVQAYLKPDGTCPLLGDTDDGRLHVLGEQHVNDHRYLLAIGAVWFNRADFKAAAGQYWEEAAWLIGMEGGERFANLPYISAGGRSQAFADGGFYFLRHGEDYVCVDAGDVGLRGRGGHGHCDVLSLEVVLCGENIVVDRGSSLYTASRTLRREVIQARSHNTIMVDDLDYARLNDYDIASVQYTPCRRLLWRATDRLSVLEAEHDGYSRLHIVHQRRVELRHDHQLEIMDRLQGEGEHQVSSRFYLTPGCEVKQTDATQCLIRTPSGRFIRVIAQGPIAGSWLVSPTVVFVTYGAEVPTLLLEWRGIARLPVELRFFWRVEVQQEEGRHGG